MKKKFIIYILFPLLILAVGMSACTEDTILADAGKLPDETTMGSIGSTLRSNSSFSGKAVIELTNDSEDGTDHTTVKILDLKRYMGLWYEIARYENRFEHGLVDVTATYTLRPDGLIRVENRGCKRNSPYDICKTANGHAKIPDPAQPGKLKVSFFLNFYSDYYVLELDEENYNYALVGSSTDKYLWILSRTPQLPEDIKKKLVTAAERRGYDTNRLQWIEQF